MLDDVKHRLEQREDFLSRYASRSSSSKGRDFPEEPPRLRTEFQRDRDRIIHSNAFRRLKHKTQVFIAPAGDHYVTRLTHTLEVSQIGRTIARALNLNEDLVEAMTLGHDLGHTPFGHLGEEELNRLYLPGFRHAVQGVRIVEHLEKNGLGLNLTWEVKDGMEAHSKPRDNLTGFLSSAGTLEAQVCRIADAVAYLNHDIGDAIRAGVISEEDLPHECRLVLGTRHSERIDTMISDIVEFSWKATGLTQEQYGEGLYISMSPDINRASNLLREFMFRHVYIPAGEGELGKRARDVICLLYSHFSSHPEEIPLEYNIRRELSDRIAVDYISGMTDHYALSLSERLQPGITGSVMERPFF